MFATKVLRASAAAERVPMIKFIGKRTIPGKNLWQLSRLTIEGCS
jgi:hypothetical protein